MGLIALFLQSVELLQLALFSIALFALILRKGEFRWNQVSWGLIVSTSLVLAYSVFLSVSRSEFWPYFVFTELLILVIGIASLRGGRRFQMVAAPLSAAIFILATFQFVEVHTRYEVEGGWRIGWPHRDSSADSIEFQYGHGNGGYNTNGITSSEVTQYLKAGDSKTVRLTFKLHYSWGHLVGLDLEAIDGKTFDMKRGYGGAVGYPPSIFPKYYWYPKALSSK